MQSLGRLQMLSIIALQINQSKSMSSIGITFETFLKRNIN